MYEVLGKNLDAHFILNKDYLQKYNIGERWEVKWVENHWGKYTDVISRLKPDNYTLVEKPEVYLKEAYDGHDLVPSELLRETVERHIPELKSTIEEVIKSRKIEAGVTWVNNECFRDTLAEFGLKTFHHEMGPFRPTVYIPTIYLDFQGVNGNTEFNRRFERFLNIADEVPILTRKELIRVLSPNYWQKLYKILDNKNREYEIGVGLQVEVDTNLLLFNEGRHWVDPILGAEADSTGKVLVRPHPAAGYIMKPIDSRLVIDDITKGNAQDFINKCNKIYCLNSSVGLEAILLGREAKIFGDSPFRDTCQMNEDMKLKALNFVVFGYLIHRDLLFNADYYKFRLGNIGNEKAIYLDNMKRLLKNSKN